MLIAPWDLSFDTLLYAKSTEADRDRIVKEDYADVDGRVAGMSARQVFDILKTQGSKWQLAKFAPMIAKRPALLIVATRDTDDDKALDLRSALNAEHPKALRVETLDSDHGFNDRRMALQSIVLKWLAALGRR